MDWLPKAGNCKNFALLFTFRPQSRLRAAEKAIGRKRREPRVPPLVRAYEFQRLLDSGEVNTRAEIARRHGISRARVTQIMNLLRLPESVQEYLVELSSEEHARYPERQLREIADIESQVGQAQAFARLRHGT